MHDAGHATADRRPSGRLDADEWIAVPDSASDPGAKVAETTVAGDTNAIVELRFGVRTALAQPPGRYVAPVSVEVIAPAV